MRHFHLALILRQAIAKGDHELAGLFRRGHEHSLSPEDARAYLREELELGREVLPCAPCDNFDFSGPGCGGHPLDAANQLVLWIVYDHPKEQPDKFVARMHLGSATRHRRTDETLVEDDLDVLRGHLAARGLTRVPRHSQGDPTAIETWF